MKKRMSPHEMIVVLLAFGKGSTIQGKSYADSLVGDWHDCEFPCWDFNSFLYRVKPKEISR